MVRGRPLMSQYPSWTSNPRARNAMTASPMGPLGSVSSNSAGDLFGSYGPTRQYRSPHVSTMWGALDRMTV